MKSVLIQICATLIISLGNFFIGFSTAWSSYTLELFESDKSPFPKLTETELTLVGSLFVLGCFISVLFTGFLCDGMGRRKTDILAGICFVLSWSLIATANNIKLLIIGRFIIGISIGIHFIASIAFVGEIASPSMLGSLFSTITFAYCFGVLMSYISGWVCSYEVNNYLNLSMSVVFVLLVTWLEETPPYLLGKGKEKEALKSLQFYRGASKPTEKILEEFNFMKSQLPRKPVSDLEKPLTDEKKALEESTKNTIQDISVWEIIKSSKPTQRALVLVITNLTLMPLGGTIAISAYAAKLFTMAAPSLSPHMCSVILALAFAVSSFISMFITDLLKRRTLLLLSSISSTSCLLLLSSVLRWKWAPQWSLPLLVLAYCFFFQLGVAVVPFLQLNEIFSSKIKSFATILCLSSMNISNFIVLALFGPLVKFCGLDGTFLVFAMLCVFIFIFNVLFLRETRGLSSTDALAMFEKGYLYKKHSC